ncbi:hypothetical protein A9Q79_02765 [Methylophaga sp. 42_25_T18]|nr:hypothetical protein A9Q79_02765 [Methylophaga sp. 42_25_T18]
MKFNRTKVAQFQEQDCKLTLREALAEFYSVNSHLFSVPEPDTVWTELLVHHDVGHVFFGVNTSILDEAAGDYWTLFGTDMSFKEYLAYAKSPEGKKLIENIGFVNIVKSLILGLPLLYKTCIQARKMNRKWKTRGYEQYMDTPLVEIRKEFNLEILKYK